MFTGVSRMLCMENLVLPFMNEGQMAHSSKTPHFMGVNSENKWSNDWRGSNECLLTVQKDISDQHTELAQINVLKFNLDSPLRGGVGGGERGCTTSQLLYT